MPDFINSSTITFFIFGIFLFLQMRHIRYFNGSSGQLHAIITLFVWAATLTGIIYLILLFRKTDIAFTACTFGFQLGLSFAGYLLLPKIMRTYVWSLFGLIIVPICAVLMFRWM